MVVHLGCVTHHRMMQHPGGYHLQVGALARSSRGYHTDLPGQRLLGGVVCDISVDLMVMCPLLHFFCSKMGPLVLLCYERFYFSE